MSLESETKSPSLVLIWSKLASVLIQCDPVPIRAHLWQLLQDNIPFPLFQNHSLNATVNNNPPLSALNDHSISRQHRDACNSELLRLRRHGTQLLVLKLLLISF